MRMIGPMVMSRWIWNVRWGSFSILNIGGGRGLVKVSDDFAVIRCPR